MMVYTTTTVSVTFTPSLTLPAGSSIYLSFPAAATQLTLGASPLTVNGANTGSSSNNGNNSMTVTTAAAIPANSTLVLSASILTPSSLGSYNYVILQVLSGSTLYLSSTTSLFLLVDTVGALPATLTPTNPTAGATSGYRLDLTITVPHPSSFLVRISLPSDVSFSSAGASCSGNCSSSIASNNFTSFTLTASNGLPSSTGHNLTFSLAATFTNPKAVGISSLWTITTMTTAPSSTITVSSTAPVITLPNVLTASFLTDSYYINNTNVVKLSFSFTNALAAGNYLLLIAPTTTYAEYTTVACSAIYGTCTKSVLSSNASLVLQIVPNISSIINNTLALTLEGLISGTDAVSSITVRSYNGTGSLVDSGILSYAISCRDNSLASILNNCKTCFANLSCIDCYTSYGFYLNGSICVSDCGAATTYKNYDSNSTGVCEPCPSSCQTCYSATVCIACQSGYYHYSNDSCLLLCDPNGFVAETVSGSLYCKQCYGNGSCLNCNSSAGGYCTLCNSSYVLSNGFCTSSCANNSMYPYGGFCYPCDPSCDTCTSSGSGGCTRCSSSYFNYTGYCLAACPSDTVANGSRVCTCDLPCTKCSGSTNYCTACNDSTMFVSQGQCLSSCPGQTYLSGTTCVPCATACANCSSSTCFSCLSSHYLYNNLCYSDCNLISQQYDVSGTSCVLCPDGCDSCSGTTCTSCLSSYTYSSSSSQCIQTCLLTSSCEASSAQVLPLPGLISVVLWTAIVVAIKLLLHKNYVPYSLILFNAIVEFILVIAVLSSAGSLASFSVARLLSPSDEERSTIRGLLGTALAVNYLSNIAYIVIFVKYIRPLMGNPRQIDFISNLVVLVLAVLSNYRLALMAFSRMFPKPFIFVNNPSKLTPVHYLCVASLLLDLIPLVGCAIAIHNEPARSSLFMLSIDLILIIGFNIVVTIWFVACAKPEEYYETDIKKYHLEDNHHTTNETIANDKDFSKANMAAQETYNFTDDEVNSSIHKGQLGDSYNKLVGQSKVSRQGTTILHRKTSD
jgi:hypothetical protein